MTTRLAFATRIGASLLVAAAATSSPAWAVRSNFEPGNLRLIDAEGTIHAMAAGPLPGQLEGELAFNFAFESTQLDPDTGLFVPPDLAVAYKLSGGPYGFGRPYDEYGWIVEEFGGESWGTVRLFDQQSGLGVMDVRVPIRSTRAMHQEYPALPPADGEFGVVVSLDGPFDDPTAPQGEYVATTSLDVSYPTAWIEVLGTDVGLGDSVLVVLHRDPDGSLGPESVDVALTPPRRFAIDGGGSQVEFGQDECMAYVSLTAVESGEVLVSAALDGTIRYALIRSSDTLAGPDDDQLDGDVQGVYWIASDEEVEDPDFVTVGVASRKECRNPVAQDYGRWQRICGPCGMDPQAPDACHGTDADGEPIKWIGYAPAKCVPKWNAYCPQTVPDKNFAVPLYRVKQGPAETKNGCPYYTSSTTDSGEVEWKIVKGRVEHTSGHAVQSSKFCCEIEHDPGDDRIIHVRHCF